MAVNEGNKPILITGGTTGIGKVTVELLASKGHQVYATVRKDRDFEKLSKINNVTPVRLDVTDLDQIQKLVEFIQNQGNGLFGLVNNSGVTDLVAISEMDDDDFDYIMQVNLYGPFRVTKALHNFIIESKGRIVNIGSVAGIVTPMLMGAYSISKHAIEAYGDALALEMKKYDVHVATIEPGNYKSNIAMSAGMRIEPKIAKRRGSKFREELKEILSVRQVTPDRSQFKTPEPVAEAIYHALFAEDPLPRYMVVPTEEEGRGTIEKAVRELVEYNKWQEYSFSRDELISMLDAYLE
jgi:NAD(P)-dependent dehydrogenase (short-subunit alcohol dehydrogenase family)